MKSIPYTLIRSNRKTIALVINTEAQLIVRAPFAVSNREIENLVEKKIAWIREKQHITASHEEKYAHISWKDGESILYLGNAYTIMQIEIDSPLLDGAFLNVPRNSRKDDITTWLKNEAKKIISQRTDYYASFMGTKYECLHLSEARKRWGSCSTNGSLRFSWKLVMCPLSVIDYVVVHELAHIAYKNHNSIFWARVKTVLPNYKEAQNWLNLNRKLIEME
ncbi:MAG: M48 family metallopeptidase [Prevotella sp.]|jgi:predicted metal-dependent hydrolase|nr:M48 family metallopeptidase [Prevotella sp.]